MSFANYFILNNKSLFNRYTYLVYLDALGYSADRIFSKNGMSKIKFMREYYQLNKPYIVVTCKIKTKELDIFNKCMEELKNNLLIMGYRDYEDYCIEFKEKVMIMLEEVK